MDSANKDESEALLETVMRSLGLASYDAYTDEELREKYRKILKEESDTKNETVV